MDDYDHRENSTASKHLHGQERQSNTTQGTSHYDRATKKRPCLRMSATRQISSWLCNLRGSAQPSDDEPKQNLRGLQTRNSSREKGESFRMRPLFRLHAVMPCKVQ
ncbi:hypothetical protein E2P81_ATG00880 [Venturia nashicola]|nr:hypothetical protein E2P81_ATG00880 [Venturia nashicola]